MKIVTINVPDSYLDAIDKLVGNGGLYPSRSELIRVAVREFLIKELRAVDKLNRYKESNMEELKDPTKHIKVPIDYIDENGEQLREFKTYKIVRRLEYSNPTRDLSNIYNLSDFGVGINFEEYENDEFEDIEETEQLKKTLPELRQLHPDAPDFKFINER